MTGSSGYREVLLRFARAYVVIAAITLHAIPVAAWQYERMTCDPTEYLGCYGLGAMEATMFYGVLGLALFAAVAVFLGSLLEVHYGGASA